MVYFISDAHLGSRAFEHKRTQERKLVRFLDKIKDKTVGHGQYGVARWATKSEIKKTYKEVLFEPQKWRMGENLPKEQGIIVGCKSIGKRTKALIDTGDVHALMIGAAGVGKTAYWLYPCIE